MHVIDKLVGIIAPYTCIGCGAEGHVLCGQCFELAGEPPPSRCAGCGKLTINHRTCKTCNSWLKVYSVHVANIYDGIYEQLVHSLKFEYKRRAAKPIARMMSQIAPNITTKFKIVVCPIPTAHSRIRQRGFDHGRLISKEFIAELRKKTVNNTWQEQPILGRKTNVRQLGSSRAQRIKQMDQEFFIKPSAEIRGKTIILLDDVMTTGSSIASAAKLLKSAGAKRVYAVVFAQK